MVKHYTFRKSEITKHRISGEIYFRHADSVLLAGMGVEELSKALIRGLPAKLRWHVVSFNPITLSETIQRILLGEATLSFDDNEHINVVSENVMATTVQRMDERLDKLEDLLKSCQLSRTAYPAEQNDQPLQRSFGLSCRTCGRNGHKSSECFRSSYGNSSWVNQHFNYNSRNYNNDNFPNRMYNNFHSQRVERSNTFQLRAIRGGYNPRYYNNGVEKQWVSKKIHTTSCIINTCSGNKHRKNKSMHSYSVMCDKNHRNNSIRGRNICVL